MTTRKGSARASLHSKQPWLAMMGGPRAELERIIWQSLHIINDTIRQVVLPFISTNFDDAFLTNFGGGFDPHQFYRSEKKCRIGGHTAERTHITFYGE